MPTHPILQPQESLLILLLLKLRIIDLHQMEPQVGSVRQCRPGPRSLLGLT